MGLFADKLEYLEGTKTAIKDAINNVGINVSQNDTFRSYSTKIDEINVIKNNIKNAIVAKGVVINETDGFNTYPTKISEISNSGGSEYDFSFKEKIHPTTDMDFCKDLISKDIQVDQGNKKVIFMGGQMGYVPLSDLTSETSKVTGIKLCDGTYLTKAQMTAIGSEKNIDKKYFSSCGFSTFKYWYIVYFDDSVGIINGFGDISPEYFCSMNIDFYLPNLFSSSQTGSLLYYDMLNCVARKKDNILYYNFTNSTSTYIVNQSYLVNNIPVVFNACGSILSLLDFDFSINPLYIDPLTLNSFYNNGFSGCMCLSTLSPFSVSGIVNLDNLFSGCEGLKCVPDINVENITSMESIFLDCFSLNEINFKNIKCNFSISSSTEFTRESLLNIIGNLFNTGAPRTLTMGATNKAKLTSEDIALATAKQWSIV